jgi:hypothetical protein
MTRAPYGVPFYPDMVGAHLLISWLAGGVLEHFIQEFHQKPWRNLFAGFLSQVLEFLNRGKLGGFPKKASQRWTEIAIWRKELGLRWTNSI